MGTGRRRERETFAPWPALVPFARTIRIGSGSRLDPGESRASGAAAFSTAFCFDSGAPDAASAMPEAPTFVFVHGLGDEADSWRRLYPLMSPRFRLVAPDLPGFGRSEAAGRVTLESAANFLLGFLDAVGIGKAILVGSSLGAVVSELVAFRAGDRIAGLVLLDGGFPAPPSSSKAIAPLLFPGLGERYYESLRGKPAAAYESLRPYYADLDAQRPQDKAFLAARVVDRVDSDTQESAYFSMLRSAALAGIFGSRVFRRGLRAFRAPLLAIWGAEDRIADRGAAALIASLAPDSAVALVGGSGHLPQQESPEELVAILERFAEKASRPAVKYKELP